MQKFLIAIVDDVAEMRALLNGILVASGFRVVLSSTGHEAIHMIEANPDINLLFVDLNLPDMSGHEVVERILPFKTQRGFKVCVVTGSKDKKDIVRAMKVGIDGYVIKPIYPKQLLVKTGTLLGIDDLIEKNTAIMCSVKTDVQNAIVQPDLTIIEVNQFNLVIKSTAGFVVGSSFEIDSMVLESKIDLPKILKLCVVSSVESGPGEFLIKARIINPGEKFIERVIEISTRNAAMILS